MNKIKNKIAQKNIPQGWFETTLEKECDVLKGQGLSKGNLFDGGKNECILYGELYTKYGEVVDVIKSHTDSEEGIGSKNGDILIPASTTTIAKDLAIATALNKDGVLLGGDINILRKKKNSYNANFLAYYLTHYKNKELSELAQGITIIHLYGKDFKKLSICIPKELGEQEKIAEILGAVDGDIAKTQELIEATEKLKKGLMQKLFTRGIGHIKFKKTKLGKIPEEWEAGKIGDHTAHVGSGATPRGGSKVYLTEGVPFIRSQNVYFSGFTREGLVYINEKTHKDMNRSKVLPNDILLNITGASIGRACIMPNYFATANVNQHVCIIRPSKDLFFQYLFYFLQSQDGQDQIFKFQIGGNREGLNFQQIRSIEFPFPSNIEEQQEIAEIFSAMDEKISINKKLKNKLTLLKKGLMQDLLSGKMRVKND